MSQIKPGKVDYQWGVVKLKGGRKCVQPPLESHDPLGVRDANWPRKRVRLEQLAFDLVEVDRGPPIALTQWRPHRLRLPTVTLRFSRRRVS